jgi:hypothetical protein
MTGPTIETVWLRLSGRGLADDLVEWPPDVFALTDVILEQSEAYRFAVSPPFGRRWPPHSNPDWSDEVARAALQWRAWAEDVQGPPPELIAQEWRTLLEEASRPLEDLASGDAWGLCEAILTLHALADEACAGMGVSVHLPAAPGWRTRARAGELLARSGSLARIPRDRLRVLPKVRTAAGGISFRSLSRYVCVRGTTVDTVWHKVPARQPGTAQQRANVLLLPWPLRIRERDFRPLPRSVQRVENEPFGFFEFAPPEMLDFDLLERVITAALDEVEHVDVIILPEAAVPPEDLDELERLLARHRVTILIAGVREPPPGAGSPFPANWVHLGVHFGGRWWRYRQNKHHRWYLDGQQIDQYNLGGALHPNVRWWEATQVPPRVVQFVELAEGITLVAVVCEDLARLDEVADLLRAVGPTLVVTLLLDGPQLTNRWTARYASVLADDPGSAVLTLTAYGMVRRSRPPGFPASNVVALWKDPTHGFREIALENGAQGILLSTTVGRTRRRSPDGRMPVDNVADLLVAGVCEVRASEPTLEDHTINKHEVPVEVDLAPVELTILTSWSEAVAEAMVVSTQLAEAVLSDARSGAPWRKAFGVNEPSRRLAAALDALAAFAEDPRAPDGDPLTRLAGRVLTSLIESRAQEVGQ